MKEMLVEVDDGRLPTEVVVQHGRAASLLPRHQTFDESVQPQLVNAHLDTLFLQ
jgi:hypothetical protein